jgi:hypothetical protein
MISILLDKIIDGVIAETIDITRYVNDQSKLLIRNEYERDAFEITIPDVDIQLSDLDQKLYNMFFSEPVTTTWKINIKKNNSFKFRGFLNNDFINRDMNDEYLNINSFSTMKRFWEIADTIKMITTPTDNGYFSTPEYVTGYWSFLDFFIKGYIKRFVENFVIQGASFDAGILIRSGTIYYRYTKQPVDASSAYYSEHLTTDALKWAFNKVSIWYLRGTLKDLLIAVAKDNNAEWYIDVETETLKLRQRNSIVTDLNEDLSDKVIDSDKIEVNLSDEKVYKYVSTYTPSDEKNIPRLDSQEHSGEARIQTDAIEAEIPGRPYGGYEYMLAMVDSMGNIIPCGFTKQVAINAGHSGGKFYYSIPTFTIPVLVGYPDVAKRRLYRLCTTTVASGSLGGSTYGGQGAGVGAEFYNNNFLFVAEFLGNAAVTFRDSESEWAFVQRSAFALKVGDKTFVLNTSDMSGTKMNIRYDETTGIWDDPVYENSEASIEGKVFDSKPSLSFLDSEDNIQEATAEMIYYFFGSLASYENLKNRWRDLMVTKRKIVLSMKDNEVIPGDAFRLRQITKLQGIGNLIVKKTADELIKETSELELITI